MNTNAILGVVLGLAVGFGGGWLMAPKAEEEQKVERARGGSGPTPSDIADDVPANTWSEMDCGGMGVGTMLDDIQSRAVAAHEAQSIDSQTFLSLHNELFKCALNVSPVTDQSMHCTKVTAAWNAAKASPPNWSTALAELTHGH